MPSQAMQDWMDAFRDQRKAGASQAAPTLAERRAAFASATALIRLPATCW